MTNDNSDDYNIIIIIIIKITISSVVIGLIH